MKSINITPVHQSTKEKDMNINPWARLLFWFIFIVVCVFVGSAFAQDNEFRLNKPAVAGITICLTQAEAVAILTTERDEGKAQADAKFLASEGCANLPLEFTPKRIVATVKTERGIARVVEIISGEKTAYWLTYQTLGFKEV